MEKRKTKGFAILNSFVICYFSVYERMFAFVKPLGKIKPCNLVKFQKRKFIAQERIVMTWREF